MELSQPQIVTSHLREKTAEGHKVLYSLAVKMMFDLVTDNKGWSSNRLPVADTRNETERTLPSFSYKASLSKSQEYNITGSAFYRRDGAIKLTTILVRLFANAVKEKAVVLWLKRGQNEITLLLAPCDEDLDLFAALLGLEEHPNISINI